MRFCFLVEEQYRNDGMPLDVVRQLRAWGHRVDVLRPGSSLLDLGELIRGGDHDAWVLKTVSGGPGLGLLEAAATVGLTTINDARAIRGVRDKAQAAVLAEVAGLPVPATWAAARPEDLARIPADRYPLVVKPADGSSGRAVHRVDRPEELAALAALGERPEGEGLLLAQPYVPNAGVDLKVYCAAGELFGTERTSPLAGDGGPVRERPVALAAEVAAIATAVGEVYGLDLYGVDILLGPDGPVVVDVNDFPSFRQVPDAVARVSRAILRLARNGSSWPSPRAAGVRIPEQVAAV
ncbi:ATP-grasp domain-containing protein [Saccharothrix sp. ST-888]|uniref:ATP-grasp domain-containing protein n=1 Tax=Saccharothrix sp. ST-888 TaxID=1427391 RepID=UPI0005EC486C|nr:30S ribosomal protein S6 modification protein RimK [Saccharothrix sp. ST-888]KJK58565.1 30S ribosomal protein S6 modification protein RimK [Saccharothrix sp. ST-888]